ncbi:MAG TPA: sialidase family protein [Mycobacteriales bacterium]|jgi:sialidase-1|nr:sialidase family protein [Mycobacteriales bacterium]
MSARGRSESALQRQIRVFGPELGTYASYRIPAVVKTGDSVLAFCEGRRNSAADSGDIDIVLRRSTDDGASWGPLQVVCSGGRDETVGNPAPVVVPGSGAVVLLSVRNGAEVTEAEILRGRVDPDRSRRVFVQVSDDGGLSFDEPRDITADTKLDTWGWYATGPGHGIALTGTGRLVIPANHSVTGVDGPRAYGAHCIYSDDGGRTWTIGFTDHNAGDESNANENTVAELPDGRLYVNARNQNGRAAGTRLDAYSPDGGRTLTAPYQPQPTISTPVVQGSLLQWPDGPLLYSGPANPGERRQLSIQGSSDAGRTWQLLHAFADVPAAYSDLVQLDARHFGVLYETGDDGPYESICFRQLELTTLINDGQETL